MKVNQECLDDLNLLVREAKNIWEHYDMYTATLQLVRVFHQRHDNMPTIRELGLMIDMLEGKVLGTTGTNTVNRRLDVLEARGDLIRETSCFSGDRRVRMKFPKQD